MSFSTEPFASRRDTVAFIVCLLLAVVARAVDERYSEPVAAALRQTVLVPLLSLQHQTELIRIRRAQFSTLMSQRDSAVVVAQEIEPLRAENERLRSILRLRQRMPVRHVAGEVLHQADPRRDVTLVLTVGGNDGVVEWAPVVAPKGLIGHIQTVDASTSVAMTWMSPEFRVSATALDSIAGIVEPRIAGEGTAMLLLREVAHRADIPDGTIVETSGLGGVYPRGIPIGRVRGLFAEREGWSKTYLLEPAVHPATVSHVLILLAGAEEVGRAFGSTAR